MFTPDELALLKHALDVTQIQGIKAAAILVSAYHKIELAQQEPNGNSDSTGSDQSSPGEPAGN